MSREKKAVSKTDCNYDIVADVDANGADTDAKTRYYIDGLPGVGTQKGHIGYDQGSDVMVLGYGADDDVQVDTDGNVSIAGNADTADGKHVMTDKVRARDGDGLYLVDDGDNGIFVEDGGQVGINDVTPDEQLSVGGSMETSDGNYVKTDKVRARDGDGLYLVDDGDNGIFVEDGGQVGIGTASPNFKLTVQEEGTDGQQLYIKQGNTDNGWLIGCDQSDGYLRFERRGEGVAPSNNIRVTINTDGDMGINEDGPAYKLDVAGTAAVGDTDGTDYTEFESDGTLKFNGAATVWKDINLGAARLSLFGLLTGPDYDEFKDSAGNDVGVETYAFAIGEEISGVFEMQHDYKEGSDFTFHIHWQGITAPGGGTDNVKWELEYTISRDGQALQSATTITAESAITAQYQFVRTDFTAITGSTAGHGGGNVQIGDQFMFRLERIAASADDYAGDALLATVGIHYEIDTVGSRQIATK